MSLLFTALRINKDLFVKEVFIITLKEHFIMSTYNAPHKYIIYTGNMKKKKCPVTVQYPVSHIKSTGWNSITVTEWSDPKVYISENVVI